jgi:cobalt/nickel transport system permease protein
VLIEQCAYTNRWRQTAPAAKGVFALSGFVAAFAAGNPASAFAVAGLMVLVTVAGAGIAFSRLARVALPPLGFLLFGSLSLAFSLDLHGTNNQLAVHWLPSGWAPIQQLAARSCGALAALLFLALTTPLTDLIALLRRLHIPDVLLDLMVLCYRMLFVFSEALHDTRTAQAARLGYATPRLALRSIGSLTANLTLQIWQRTHALQIAAQARNNDTSFRFLVPEYVHAQRDLCIAAAGGMAMIFLVAGFR